MTRSISVIIPNYNGRYLLEIILPDLIIALKNINSLYEIIISDDASTDDSVSFIKDNYPDLVIVENISNAGFSVTVNHGASVARYDLLFFLNNDVKLTKDYFLELLKHFDKEDTFGVNGRVIGWEDDNIQDAAKLPYFQGAKLKTSRNYYYKEKSPADVYTFYLTGSNALIDRKKFNKIGGFNEIFSPFYCEDLELSVRAWKAGWKCYYEHQAICRHKISATTSSLKKKKYVEIIYNRNKFIFHYLHLSGFRYFSYLIQIFLEALMKMLLLNIAYFKSIILFIHKMNVYKIENKQRHSNISKCSISQIISFIEEKMTQEEVIIFKN